jgi:hypothetical protein
MFEAYFTPDGPAPVSFDWTGLAVFSAAESDKFDNVDVTELSSRSIL